MTEKYTKAATNPRGVALSGARGSVPRRGGHRPDWDSQHRANAGACTTWTEGCTHFAVFICAEAGVRLVQLSVKYYGTLLKYRLQLFSDMFFILRPFHKAIQAKSLCGVDYEYLKTSWVHISQFTCVLKLQADYTKIHHTSNTLCLWTLLYKCVRITPVVVYEQQKENTDRQSQLHVYQLICCYMFQLLWKVIIIQQKNTYKKYFKFEPIKIIFFLIAAILTSQKLDLHKPKIDERRKCIIK